MALSLAVILGLIGCTLVSAVLLPHPFQPPRFLPPGHQSQLPPHMSVRPPSCTILQRSTRYENVKLPFLCDPMSGRSVPLPPKTDLNNLFVSSRLQAEGLLICHKILTVPIHRFQRIPVCCPGTIPLPAGGCLCQRKAMQMMGRMDGPVPTPGQLLMMQNQALMQRMSGHPALSPRFQQRPLNPVDRLPRPHRVMIQKIAKKNNVPENMVLKLFSTIAQNLQKRNQNMQALKPGSKPTPGNMKRPGPAGKKLFTRPGPVPKPILKTMGPNARQLIQKGPPTQHKEQEIALFLSAMLYHEMQVERRQQGINEEFARRAFLRQQMGQYLMMLKQRQAMEQMIRNRMQALASPTQGTNADPRPIPSPPTKNPLSQPEEDRKFDAAINRDADLERLTQGILGNAPHQNAQPNPSTPRPAKTSPQVPMKKNEEDTSAQILQKKEQVKSLIRGCLSQAGIDTPIKDILRSADITQLRPICEKSEIIGPCVMNKAPEIMTQDQAGMVGHHMIQAIIQSLGQMCQKLFMMDQHKTSPSVFPNPAPSISNREVTNGAHRQSNQDTTPSLINEEPVKHSNINKHHSKPSKIEDQKNSLSDTKLQNNPESTKPKASANTGLEEVHETVKLIEEEKVTVGSLPMWLILSLVGALAALILFICLIVCLVMRCRRKKKIVEIERDPEKLPADQMNATCVATPNIYSVTPCVPPPTYSTTPVKQNLQDVPEEEEEVEFKIPEDVDQPKSENEAAASAGTQM